MTLSNDVSRYGRMMGTIYMDDLLAQKNPVIIH